MIKKAQFSAVELILLILLFAFSSGYYIKSTSSTEQDYKTSIESGLDSIYYSENFREKIMDESLIVPHLTQDWSSVNTTISKLFYNFELKISNITTTKTIFECNYEYNTKHIAQRIISIKDNSTFEFRTISLGVCY